MSQRRDIWSGRIGFILATVGSAVGLGSIWKFPYEVGSNGGSAFVLFYVAGLIFIVVPLMFAEFAIGRRGGSDAARNDEAAGAGQDRALARPGGVREYSREPATSVRSGVAVPRPGTVRPETARPDTRHPTDVRSSPGRSERMVSEPNGGGAEDESWTDMEDVQPDLVEAIPVRHGMVLAGRYAIERIIGRGGSGVVVRAHDRDLKEVVAIKIVRAELAGQRVWAARLAREVRLARQIQHPHVCRVFDFQQADGRVFLVMELAERGTLRDEIRSGALAERR